MSSSSQFGKAFKIKAKHVSAILDLPLQRAQDYLSRILGYRDLDEAHRAGLVVRELASQAHLRNRIRDIVPGIAPDKVDQLVNELNLPTADRVIAQLREGGKPSADYARYFSPDGMFSEYYHQCLDEVAPVFKNIRKLSRTLGTVDRDEVDTCRVVASLANLSREDADAALELLSSCYAKYRDFLPVNVAMLVLHAGGTRRSTRVLASKTLAIYDGMLACSAASRVRPQSYCAVRAELKSYGLAIAAVHRRLGAHDVCLAILDGLVRSDPTAAPRFDVLEQGPIRLEAAFAALFARHFHLVPGFLSATINGRRIPLYLIAAIEAIAWAETGDERKASPLVDVLLCNQEVRLGLGLDDGGFIPRRRPENMPFKDDILDVIDGPDLDRLRYLDLAAFKTAHALFLKRNTYMLGKLAASALSFRELRIFPELQFSEKQDKRDKRNIAINLSKRYTPAIVRIGPAHGDTHIDVVVILRSDFAGREWLMPSHLAHVFQGNACLEQDLVCRRWLAHILSSGYVEAVVDEAGFRTKSGLGIRERYRKGAALARDEISFEIFRETEHLEHPHARALQFGTVADDLALMLADTFRASLAGHLW